MKKNLLISLLLIGVLLFSACLGETAEAPNTTKKPAFLPTPTPTEEIKLTEIRRVSLDAPSAAFSLAFLRACAKKDENVLIAPDVLYTMLALLAEGTAGQTKEEIESLLGGDIASRREFLKKNRAALDAAKELHSACALWVNQTRGELKDEYRTLIGRTYGVQAETMPFDDAAVTRINAWFTENAGLPYGPLEETDALLLTGALSFSAKWETEYEPRQVTTDSFTLADGETVKIPFLSSTETAYIENDSATGFIKPFKDDRFRFAAILPKDDVTVDDLLTSLTDETLQELLNSAREATVYTALPRFSVSWSGELTGVFRELGMIAAFGDANFSPMTDSAVFLNGIKQKTAFSLDENGAQAGAISAIALLPLSWKDEIHYVFCQKPFLYLLLDTETDTPILLGVMNDPQK